MTLWCDYTAYICDRSSSQWGLVAHNESKFTSKQKESFTSQLGSSKFSCVCDASINGLQSQCSIVAVELECTAQPHMAALLGFSTLVPAPALTVQSDLPMQNQPFTTVKVHINGIVPNPSNASNGAKFAGQLVQACNVIAAFPVDAAAYCWFHFTNSDNSFTLTISDKCIRQLSFRFTEWIDLPLTQLTERLVSQIDTYKAYTDDKQSFMLCLLRMMPLSQLANG